MKREICIAQGSQDTETMCECCILWVRARVLIRLHHDGVESVVTVCELNDSGLCGQSQQRSGKVMKQ